MKINADLTQGVVVDTNSLEWAASPQAGVERRMLDRDGAEVARATTIVRFAPGSSFPAHAHGGGEEIFVLEGVLSDEYGDYPAGTYIRDPIGSSHAPFSKDGCTILVKLHQMTDPAEQRLVVHTNVGEWEQGTVPGAERQSMFHSKATGEWVYLARFAPGTKVADDPHPGGEEIFVLDGLLRDEYGSYPAGTWLRQPDGSRHAPFSETGCTLWVKRGHLPPVDGH